MARQRRAKRNADKGARWASRIVEHADVAPAELMPNPNNWRVHSKFQGEALRGIMEEVGWIQEVIVNRRTGRLIDGHYRVALAIEDGEPTVPVKYVDVSEDEEKLLLATFDPIGALASTGGEALTALLNDVDPENRGLIALLGELGDEADALSLTPAAGASALRKSLSDKQRLVKAVIYVEDVAAFEEAMRLTGLMNRGDALMTVCKEYVERHEKR